MPSGKGLTPGFPTRREFLKISGFSVGTLAAGSLLQAPVILAKEGSPEAMPAEDEHSPKLIEGAKGEGKVLLYTTASTAEANTLMKNFGQRYPFLKTEYYRAGSDKIMLRALAEQQRKKPLADVIMIIAPECDVLKEKGVFGRYVSPHRESFVDKDPDGYWTDAYLTINAIGYNTKLVPAPAAPKTYNDLLDPRWKGKMGMDTKAFYWFASVLKMMGEEKGLEYMRKLSEQNIQFRTGRTLLAQLMAAGEISIGITLYNYRVEKLKMEGAPVEWIAIEPVIAEVHPVGITSNAPHPYAARLLLNWLLSRDGQAVLAGIDRIPSRIDVDPVVPKLKKGLKIAPYDASIAKDYHKYVNLYHKILMKR